MRPDQSVLHINTLNRLAVITGHSFYQPCVACCSSRINNSLLGVDLGLRGTDRYIIQIRHRILHGGGFHRITSEDELTQMQRLGAQIRRQGFIRLGIDIDGVVASSTQNTDYPCDL